MNLPSTVGAVVRAVEQRLRRAGIDSARLDARLLLGHVLNVEAMQVFMHPERILNPEEEETIERLALRRERREPMAHILGVREFWGLPFRVSRAVLTPRPDTETLIETALESFPNRESALRVLDLGTGSGCLLLSMLSEYAAASGVGVDLSPDALAVARENARALGLAERADFVSGSWDEFLEGRFDAILSNPPYIPESDIPILEPEVFSCEPRLALIGGDEDGLSCYRALAPVLMRRLSDSGLAFIEVGYGQAEPVSALFEEAGLEVPRRVRDLANIERCLMVQRKKVLEG